MVVLAHLFSAWKQNRKGEGKEKAQNKKFRLHWLENTLALLAWEGFPGSNGERGVSSVEHLASGYSGSDTTLVWQDPDENHNGFNLIDDTKPIVIVIRDPIQ